jgi:hypothetical protein
VFKKNKQDGVLDQDKTMDNVQKHNICTHVPSSQILDLSVSLTIVSAHDTVSINALRNQTIQTVQRFLFHSTVALVALN